MPAQKPATRATGKATPQRGRPPLDRDERKRILDATAKVFLERGFRRASTSEIARRAHTSKQTLYALFPNKADLFVGVMSAHTDQLFARHNSFIESGKSPRQTLTEIGHLVLGKFSSPEFLALYRIVVAEAHEFPDLARQLWRECMERGYGLLAEYLQSRRIGGPRYNQAAAQFISFVLGDFILNTVLNPDRSTSKSALHAKVQQAVDDYLRLHPAREPRK